MKKFLTFGASILLASAVVACTNNDSSQDENTAADNDQITVVATTGIWGSIAETALEDTEGVAVETILNSTSVDPHEYEPSAQDLAKIMQADVLLANGGGYDNWLTKQASELVPDTPIISALPTDVEHSHGDADHAHDDAHSHDGDVTDAEDDHAHDEDTTDATEDDHGHSHEVNPHIWFDFHVVETVANELMQQLHSMDSTIPDTATTVTEQIEVLETKVQELPAAGVLVTEPVADYLVDESNLQDQTPASFAEAINKEVEPSAADIAEARDVLQAGEVQILITNTQSETQATAQITQVARDNDIAIVNIAEMPDAGESYFDYANAAVDQLQEAAA